MGDNGNLIPQSERTKEEQRAIASAGGKASAAARRARKTLKEELLLLLSDGDIQERLSLALIGEALNGNKAGSVTKAFETIRDTIGEKPVDKVEQVNIDMEYQQSVEYVKRMMQEDDE